VSYGPDGKIQTVRYHELIPMLLNELQKQASEIQQLRTSQERQIRALQQRLQAVKQVQLTECSWPDNRAERRINY
jgi:hypothetical protein